MTVDAILTDILKREGWPQVTARAADKGGLTKGGVTFDEYNRWRKKRGQDAIAPTDFPLLTEDDARAFMLDDIAGPIAGVRSIDEALFALMFDWATTSGPDDPVRALQQALRALGVKGGAGLLVDGVYGSYTSGILRLLDENEMEHVRRVTARARVAFYVKVGLGDPAVRAFRVTNPNSQLENLLGWVNRAMEFC